MNDEDRARIVRRIVEYARSLDWDDDDNIITQPKPKKKKKKEKERDKYLDRIGVK